MARLGRCPMCQEWANLKKCERYYTVECNRCSNPDICSVCRTDKSEF